MKLVEIKDVRVGQIYNKADEFRIIVSFEDEPYSIAGNSYYASYNGAINLVSDFEDMESIETICETHNLIGFLGITHEIKDNKLVEIPRTTEFQTDDVVKFKWDPRLYVINREIDFGIKETHPNNHCFEATHEFYGSRQLIDFELKCVGILGVTHEFVNERLTK